MFNVTNIRKDFPILSRLVNGKPLVYLDNAATSQKPNQVIQALTECYTSYNSNVHRGVHTLSMEATDRYEAARQKIAKFINAPSPESIIFVRNATEAINLVANTWALENISPGDQIITTEMEHHSNLVPWQHISQKTNSSLDFIPVNEEGYLELDSLTSLISKRTKLISIGHVSNLMGTINPVKLIGEIAHQHGAYFMVDAAQSVPHMPTDVSEIDCDFLAFSGHKMMAPPGIGVLYIKPSIMENMMPFLKGGEMVQEVWLDKATWNNVPLRFEAGTPNYADAIALGAAIDYLNSLGMENVRSHEMEITKYAMKALESIDGVKILGPKDHNLRGGLVSLYSDIIHPHDLGTIMDQEGIAIRTGHHCVMPMHRKLGLAASARASFYIYNTNEEVDIFVNNLEKALDYFSSKIGT